MSELIPHMKTEENKSNSENINIISNNNPINTHSDKKICLYIRPISIIEKNDEKINNLIQSSFNDPDKFFSIDSPVQVGTRIKLQKLNLSPQKDKHRASHSVRLPQKKVNMSTKISVTDTSRSLYPIKEKQGSTSLMLNKEFIDNNNLKKIFENYKNQIYRNRNLRKNENSYSRSVKDINKSSSTYNNSKTINDQAQFPYELYKSLNYQNKLINYDLDYSRRINVRPISKEKGNFT